MLTTVSNDEKAELSYQAGADDVILYTRSDFGDEVKRLTEGRGLAAVYDSIGKSTVEQSLSCLKARGTFVLYGSASGDVPPMEKIGPAAPGHRSEISAEANLTDGSHLASGCCLLSPGRRPARWRSCT